MGGKITLNHGSQPLLVTCVHPAGGTITLDHVSEALLVTCLCPVGGTLTLDRGSPEQLDHFWVD